MKNKERFLTALRGGEPDRVPIAPDISNMIPCKLTGKPFWDVYIYSDPPLNVAYMNAVKKYEFDAWYVYGSIPGGRVGRPPGENTVYCQSPLPMRSKEWRWSISEESYERKLVKLYADTPYGRLDASIIYFRNSPPWTVEKVIKNPEEDWPKLRYLIGEEWEWEPKIQDDIAGDLGVYGVGVYLPWDLLFELRHGGIRNILLDFHYYPELTKEFLDHYKKYVIEFAKACIEAGVEEILIAGSASSNSFISPRIYEKINLPLIKGLTQLCNSRGVVSHIHHCGKSRCNIEILYEHALVDVVEPLERPPGGDIDLAEAKKLWGNRFCLKGNVNTFETMVSDDPKVVEAEVLVCLLAAAEGGAYVLATGDQVPLDAPEINMFTLVRTGEEYGKYPLNKNKIRKRLESLENVMSAPVMKTYEKACVNS